MKFALKTMDFALKTMKFVLKTMDFAHKCEGMLELGPAHWGTALSAMRFMLLV